MNQELLEGIFYDAKTGLQSYDKFRAKVKEQHPEISGREVKAFYRNQEINQLSKKAVVKTDKMYKITGPELTFQIDLMFIPKAIKTKEEKKLKAKKEGLCPTSSFYTFLLCIEVLTRKAYIYPMPNKQEGSIMTAYFQFIKDVKRDTDEFHNTADYFDRDKPYGIITDDGFDFKAFNEYNDDHEITVDAKTAYNDHITGGDRLGLIDRLVRTVKNIFTKYVYATHGKKYSVKSVMKQIVDNYNDTIHKSLDGLTPNQAFSSKETRMAIFDKNQDHNNELESSLNFSIGDTVRILEKKEAFSKEKPQFSKGIYTIAEHRGYKFYVKDQNNKLLKRGLNPSEINKIDANKLQNANPVNKNAEIRQNQKVAKAKRDLKKLDVEESNIIYTKRQGKKKQILDI